MKFIILLLSAAFIIEGVNAIIGYDYTQKFTNYTTFSLIDIGDCDIPDPIINNTKTQISLVSFI